MIIPGRLQKNINTGIKLRISVGRKDLLQPKSKALIKKSEQKTVFDANKPVYSQVHDHKWLNLKLKNIPTTFNSFSTVNFRLVILFQTKMA